jgi:anti-sigma factor ChrR (cupin superfamily)
VTSSLRALVPCQAANSGTYFNPHRHFGGEEIFVVDGVFEDEHGRYPKGFWLRSPHMSAHKPFSVEGCTILVKTGHLLVD